MDTAFSGVSKLTWLALAALLAGGFALASALPASASGPTCAEFGWANHGEHIVGDYVVGGGVEWPPAGQVDIGGDGPAAPGAPGIFNHHVEGLGWFQPGASFCADANSPTGPEVPRGHNND